MDIRGQEKNKGWNKEKKHSREEGEWAMSVHKRERRIDEEGIINEV